MKAEALWVWIQLAAKIQTCQLHPTRTGLHHHAAHGRAQSPHDKAWKHNAAAATHNHINAKGCEDGSKDTNGAKLWGARGKRSWCHCPHHAATRSTHSDTRSMGMVSADSPLMVNLSVCPAFLRAVSGGKLRKLPRKVVCVSEDQQKRLTVVLLSMMQTICHLCVLVAGLVRCLKGRTKNVVFAWLVSLATCACDWKSKKMSFLEVLPVDVKLLQTPSNLLTIYRQYLEAMRQLPLASRPWRHVLTNMSQRVSRKARQFMDRPFTVRAMLNVWERSRCFLVVLLRLKIFGSIMRLPTSKKGLTLMEWLHSP